MAGKKSMGIPATMGIALLAPTLLVVTWGILRFGGSIETMQVEERSRASKAGVAANRAFALRLRNMSEGEFPNGAVVIEVDEEGMPQSPLEPRSIVKRRVSGDNKGADAELSTAVDIAMDLEARGLATEALRFFESEAAGAAATFPGQALLAYARCLDSVGQTAKARMELTGFFASDTQSSFASKTGNMALDLGLLAALLDARLAARAGDGKPAAKVMMDVLEFRRRIPAAAWGPLQAWFAELGITADNRKAKSFAAAVTAFRALETGRLEVPTQAMTPKGGGLLLPVTAKPDRLLVLPGWLVDEVLDASLNETQSEYADFHFVTGKPHGSPLASLLLEPLQTWLHLLPATPLGSSRLETLANSLLFLAVLAFLAGNFLVIRVLKREFALTRMKGEFIDLVSHELRTPLTALSLKAEMLAHGAVPEEKREAYAKALHAETNKLTTLVQQVLDFARLEKGRVALSFEEVPARSLLAQGLNEGRAAIADAEQTINVDVPRDLPLLHVDKAVLTRALRNLLENASKYAPKGSAVTLSAKLEHDRIRIEVKDEGGGIPRSERRRIFQAFERGSQVKSRNRPGSGLGLAIVEEAVRAHAGTVAVQDGDHGGSVFVLEFPVSGGRG